MRRLIFGVLLVPLFIGLLVVLFGTQVLTEHEPIRVSDLWENAVFTSAGVLSLVTAFLLSRRFSRKFTFHWLYLLGLTCLCVALAEVLHELGREYSWDPDGFSGYQVLSHILFAVSTLVLGLSLLITAVFQDFRFPNEAPEA